MTRVQRLLAVALGGIVVCASVAARPHAQASGQLDSGALTSLVQEVHQLRLAVEETTRSQTQTQALSVYLSAEQSRMVQISGRLDAAQAAVDVASARARELATTLANLQAQLATASVNEPGRPQWEMEARQFKQQADQASDAEQVARARQSELSQALQTEEAHWADLIARLEQIVKK